MRRIATAALLLAAGSAAAMTVDEARAFMSESRARFLSAKSYHIEYVTTAMGIKTESRCWIRRDSDAGVSILNESQAKPFGIQMPKMTQMVTGGKVYMLSAIAPNKAFHVKSSDGQVRDDVFCNFFTENGMVEPVSDTKDKCVIRFTPTASELKILHANAKAGGGLLAGIVLPVSFRYVFKKPSKDISEIVGCNAKGEETLKVAISKLELNASVNDSRFALPKDCKVIDIKSAAEAVKLLAGGLFPAARTK